MTEPKIVHLPPREKNPAREPNETWDTGERLFGLEELLLHMPPIRKLHLERGRLKDLVRLSGYSLGTVSRVLNNQPKL